MSETPAHAAGMSPLQRLILDRMRSRGWTPKDVEDRGVKHATLHRYMNPVQLKSPPRRSVMQDLATALDLPVSDVHRAAVESVGYEYTQEPEPTRPAEVVRVEGESPEEATQRIIDLVRAHPGLHPVTKAHLEKQIEILAMIPLEVDLEPHTQGEVVAAQAAETAKRLERLRAGRKAPRNGK